MTEHRISNVALSRFGEDSRILAAYLIGSAANGTLRPDSDIDFGLLMYPGKTLSGLEINDLSSNLAQEFGRHVDIGLVSTRNLIYAKQCILGGRQVFCRDVFLTGLATATLLGLAMQLSFESREIVHAYTA